MQVTGWSETQDNAARGQGLTVGSDPEGMVWRGVKGEGGRLETGGWNREQVVSMLADVMRHGGNRKRLRTEQNRRLVERNRNRVEKLASKESSEAPVSRWTRKRG